MPEKLHLGSNEQSGLITRRNLLKAMGAASVLLTASDLIAPEFMYGSERGRVGLVESSYSPGNKTNILILGGFGVRSTETMANILELGVPSGYNLLYADYPRDSLNVQGTMNQFTDISEYMGVHSAVLIGHSMGGTVAVESLAYTRGLQIPKIILLGSPFSDDNIKENKLLAQIWAWTHYPAGPNSQMGIESWNNVFTERLTDRSIAGQFKESWRRATTGTSPRLKASAVQKLRASNLYDYRRFVQDETEFYYIGPINPDDDDVVDEEESIRSWNTFVGGDLHEILLPNIGHANPVQQPDEYRNALAKILRTPEQNRALARKQVR